MRTTMSKDRVSYHYTTGQVEWLIMCVSIAEADHYDWNLEIHLNHCADILYQTISCSNNVNLVTRHWTEGKEYPFPDL